MANSDEDGYARVIKHFGSATALGLAIGKTRAAISKWNGAIPEWHILRISMLTGIPPEQVAPQTYRRMMTPKKGKSREKAEKR